MTQYYRVQYPNQTFDRQDLVDLDKFASTQKIVIVDSCGWYYEQQFPSHNIFKIEGLNTCKTMGLTRNQFDQLFDDRDLLEPKFPAGDHDGCILILDHSTLLKYRDPPELQTILQSLIKTYNPQQMIIRLGLLFYNDNRFDDRLKNLCGITPSGYSLISLSVNFEDALQSLLASFKKNQNFMLDQL